MFIGTARRMLFVDEPTEWNELVREITADHEDSEEKVDMDDVCAVLKAIYRRRATMALWGLGRE